MILEVSENQQKTSKFIKALQRAESKAEAKIEKEEMNKLHSTRYSTAGVVKTIQQAAAKRAASEETKESPATSLAVAAPDQPSPAAHLSSAAAAAASAPTAKPEKPRAPDPNEQHKWGRNMLLVVDFTG